MKKEEHKWIKMKVLGTLGTLGYFSTCSTKRFYNAYDREISFNELKFKDNDIQETLIGLHVMLKLLNKVNCDVTVYKSFAKDRKYVNFFFGNMKISIQTPFYDITYRYDDCDYTFLFKTDHNGFIIPVHFLYEYWKETEDSRHISKEQVKDIKSKKDIEIISQKLVEMIDNEFIQ